MILFRYGIQLAFGYCYAIIYSSKLKMHVSPWLFGLARNMYTISDDTE